MACPEDVVLEPSVRVESHPVPDHAAGMCFREFSTSVVLLMPTQVSTYLVAYANGPLEYLESSYTSPLSGKVRPLRFYGKSRVIVDPALARSQRII